MASSSAAAESSSNGGDDLLTGDLGKNDYDWLLTPPGSPPASSYHYNSSENGESFLADPTALPNLVRSLAAIKTSRTQAASSKPDLITTKVKDSSLFSQRNNNGWNTAARSTTSNGPLFSTINSKKLSSSAASASASMPGSRPLSRSSTPTKRNPNAGMLPSRPTTPTSRSNQRQPSTTTLTSSSSSSSRPTTPTMRSRTLESSVARTSGSNHIGASSSSIHSSAGTGNSSTTNASLSRASTPSKRPSPQPASQMMMRSSSVNKARPLPSRSVPSSRSTSPNGKAPAQHSGATWQQLSALPGFAAEPPPNLRTSTTATRPSSNLRGSYSSPMESHPNPASSSTASRSDGHDLLINPRRASDGHDLLIAPHRAPEGVDLIGHQPPNGHDILPRRASDGPNLASRRGFASPARTRSGTTGAVVPPGPTLDRSNSTGASLLISRGSGGKADRSPNAAAKSIEKMIQSRRPVASTSSFHYSETMPRGTLMSQMKVSAGGGKPASPTASSSSSSRDVAGLLRTSPRKPVDFSWNKESKLHSVLPTSALYGGRRTQEMPSQHNNALSSAHDASLGQHGIINSSTAHDLELASDLGEEFMAGEFGTGKLLASPMSQGDSFSSLVKDSRVNNWLGSPEMYKDEVAEADTGKTAATPNRLEMATIHKELATAAHVVETPSNMCRHGSVASTCDLCLVKLRLQRLNEKCKASLTASFQASNDYSWKSSLSNGTLSARQH